MDDYEQDDNGKRRATLLFIYELAVGEKLQVNGITAKPSSAMEIMAAFPAVSKYNLINSTDLQKFDTGDMVWESVAILGRPGEAANTIADKAKIMYASYRTRYMTNYARRYVFAGKDIPL